MADKWRVVEKDDGKFYLQSRIWPFWVDIGGPDGRPDTDLCDRLNNPEPTPKRNRVPAPPKVKAAKFVRVVHP